MYVKLFGTILTSSIWSEDPATRLVWITLLTLADEDGYVRAAPSGIARAANVPQVETRKALKKLEGPDLESGVQDYGGRRIEPVEGGWYLLNYTKYREIQTKKQLQTARRMRRHRAKKRDMSRDSVTSDDVTPYAEAEAEAEAEKLKALVPLCGTQSEIEQFLENSRQHAVTVTDRRKIAIGVTFSYWAKVMTHPNAILDRKRLNRIASRLKENDDNLSELLYAIDGAGRDDYLMGRDPKSPRRYDGIETILRDRGQVERLAGSMKEYRSNGTHPIATHYGFDG